VSALPSAIAAERPAEDGKPKVTFRHAGDRFLLVEYGEMVFDLQLNFRVLTANAVLRERGLEGLLDTGPGLRSNLIRYDPSLLEPDRLIDELNAVEDEVPAGGKLEIPSRVIHLPIAFDDSRSGEAVERYMRSVREDAPNVEGSNNIDYIVRYNGLADREALYEEVLSTEWWNAFTGFFPGLPFMYPLDPRYAVFAPKYNPTRTWTAEGAVGLGGPCVAIYPVESPGGYQLFGRTLPIYDLAGNNAAFRPDPILVKPGDRVKFHRVTEEVLDAAWEEVRADRYEYRLEEDPFDVEKWMRHCDEVADEADEHRRRREAAAEGTPVP
jgi:allophanate hydrolase subunit 1